MTHIDLQEALSRERIRFETTQGWLDRETTGSFTPIGVMIHHTGFDKDHGDIPSLGTVIRGKDGLPGPLCNILIGRHTARAFLISDGRANDSGMGSSVVLEEIRRNVAPRGDATDRNLVDTVSGNPYFYDIEVENDGRGEKWAPDVTMTLTRVSTAICRAHGWSAARVLGHREWTTRKIDPSGISMAILRSNVMRLLRERQDRDNTIRERIDRMPMLRLDSRGVDVRRLQALLLANRVKPEVSIDGRFGRQTDAAVRRFQDRENLSADGVVGRRTWLALLGI